MGTISKQADYPPDLSSVSSSTKYLQTENSTEDYLDKVNYFSVSLGRKMSRAKYSLPNPYHVQNLLRSMVERLPVDCSLKNPEMVLDEVDERSRAVIIGPE